MMCHPTQDRPLSIQEYARIQQFPDDWKFMGTSVAKYRQIGNAVPVGLATALGKAVLSVADDGIGISEENLEKIWNRFYQVEPSRNEDAGGGGIGLGLSMVKQIAVLLGGEVSVESTLGKGTIFSFSMRLKKN